jgi:hypothetical protein
MDERSSVQLSFELARTALRMKSWALVEVMVIVKV